MSKPLVSDEDEWAVVLEVVDRFERGQSKADTLAPLRRIEALVRKRLAEMVARGCPEWQLHKAPLTHDCPYHWAARIVEADNE